MRVDALRTTVSSRLGGLAPALITAILFTLGCSRHTPDLPTEATTQTSSTPFQSEAAARLETDGQTSTGADEEQGPPFQKPDVVPAGALLTVRLKDAIVGVSGSKIPFEALLDDPVVAEGTPVIPRDTVVSGEIESAQRSTTRPDRAYLSLKLNAVEIYGASAPIQTASLYVRRQPSTPAPDPITIRLEKGQSLTFRLTKQVFLRPNVPKRSQ